jgi:hypothetical protein
MVAGKLTPPDAAPMVLRQYAGYTNSVGCRRRGDSMASRTDKPIEGERYKAKYPRDYPASPSGLPPLPYCPNLKRELRSVTAALVITYPSPSPAGRIGFLSSRASDPSPGPDFRRPTDLSQDPIHCPVCPRSPLGKRRGSGAGSTRRT